LWAPRAAARPRPPAQVARMPRGKKSDDDEEEEKKSRKTHGSCCGSCEIDGGIVVFLNLLSFAAGVAMVGVGGLLIHDAIERESLAQMSVDRWIVTIYSMLMGILVIASSGACQPGARGACPPSAAFASCPRNAACLAAHCRRPNAEHCVCAGGMCDQSTSASSCESFDSCRRCSEGA
jgi:hypothetical protein